MRNIWKSEEDKLIIDKYGTLTIEEMAKFLPERNYNAIKARQTFLGVCKKYSKNESFFEKANTINSSIAGILASDGHLSPRKEGRSGRVCIGINTKDVFLLQEINRLTDSNYKICSTEKNAVFNDKKSQKVYNYIDKKSSLHISSADKWIKDISENWNVHSGKKSSNLEPPQNLNDMDNCLAYISGIITGDGSIFVNGPQKENCIRISILGTQNILIWIKSVFEKFLGSNIKSEIRGEHGSKTLFSFYVNGISAARIIHKINSLNILKLTRKWQKPEVLGVINTLKYKYPSLFNEKLKDATYLITELLQKNSLTFQETNKIFSIPSLNTVIRIVEFNNSQEPKKQSDFLESRSESLVIQVFESEILRKTQIVMARLKHYLGLIKRRIFARKCEIKHIDFNTKNRFLNKYHIQGQDYGSGIFLGLFYKKRLVCIMTFAKRDGKYDLSRFCGINNFNVIGGAGKLLSFFEKTYKPESIFSFADKRWSVGNLYFKLGFALTKQTEPSYFYFKPKEGELNHKFGFRHRALSKKLSNYDPNLTEWENMKNHGWNKIYDCGLLKFEKNYTNPSLFPAKPV